MYYDISNNYTSWRWVTIAFSTLQSSDINFVTSNEFALYKYTIWNIFVPCFFCLVKGISRDFRSFLSECWISYVWHSQEIENLKGYTGFNSKRKENDCRQLFIRLSDSFYSARGSVNEKLNIVLLENAIVKFPDYQIPVTQLVVMRTRNFKNFLGF